jgi:Fe-S-cluster containining protein
MPTISLPTVHICQDCTECCDEIGLPPFEVRNPDLGPQGRAFVERCGVEHQGWLALDTELFVAMPPGLRAEHAAMLRDLPDNPEGRPCAWLDRSAKRCRHYEWRPAACREWVPGCVGCVAATTRGAQVVWRGDAAVREWQHPRWLKPVPLQARLRAWWLRQWSRMPVGIQSWTATRIEWAKTGME